MGENGTVARCARAIRLAATQNSIDKSVTRHAGRSALRKRLRACSSTILTNPLEPRNEWRSLSVADCNKCDRAKPATPRYMSYLSNVTVLPSRQNYLTGEVTFLRSNERHQRSAIHPSVFPVGKSSAFSFQENRLGWISPPGDVVTCPVSPSLVSRLSAIDSRRQGIGCAALIAGEY